MAPLHSVLAAIVVIVTSLAALTLPQTASAQLPSFWAVKLISLEPAPGAERVAKDLGSYLRVHYAPVNDPSDVPPEMRAQFARCIVRHDLPKPRPLGLECFDHAGAYVGTLRAKNVRQLWWDSVSSYFFNGRPTAHPLTAYGYIYVEPLSDDPHLATPFVAQLLRRQNVWQIIESIEAVPAERRGDLLRCRIKPAYAASGWTLRSALEFTDAAGQQVFSFDGYAYSLFDVAAAVRKSLTGAVHELVRARKADEDIYSPPPRREHR